MFGPLFDPAIPPCFNPNLSVAINKVSENSVLFHKTGYQFKRFAQFYSDKTSFDFMKNMSNSEGTAN